MPDIIISSEQSVNHVLAVPVTTLEQCLSCLYLTQRSHQQRKDARCLSLGDMSAHGYVNKTARNGAQAWHLSPGHLCLKGTDYTSNISQVNIIWKTWKNRTKKSGHYLTASEINTVNVSDEFQFSILIPAKLYKIYVKNFLKIMSNAIPFIPF